MSEYKKVKIGDFLEQYRNTIWIDDSVEYGQITISSKDGVKFRCLKIGKEIGRKRQFVIDLKSHPNTVIFTRQGIADGSIGIAPSNVNGCIATENMPMFSVNENIILVEYLENLLISPVFKELVATITPSGSAQKSIHERDLLQLEITLPDLETQKEIVKKVSINLKNVGTLTKEIDSQKAYIKQLRQNILQDAIESQSNIRIYRIENLLVNDRKGMMTGPFGTLISKNDHKSFGIPMLGIENIGKGKFIKGNKIFVTKEKANELKNYSVRANDIIISRSGTVGEICSIPQEYENALISTNLIKITLNQSIIYSDYFVLLFQCKGIIIDQVKKICSGSTRLFLTQGILKQISFPVPSLEIQLEILNKVDKIFEKVLIIEQQISQREEYANQLMQSILKDAFEE